MTVQRGLWGSRLLGASGRWTDFWAGSESDGRWRAKAAL